MRRFARIGVVGHPIAQSLSPYLHNPWMAEQGIEGEYVRIDGGDLGFAATVKKCRDEGFVGLNVTTPYKAEALALADTASDSARQIGAANLLIFTPEGIKSDNTDCTGFSLAVKNSGWTGPRRKARVLGAGGAAPAILLALRSLGFEQISLTNRTHAKSQELADGFEGVTTIPWADRDKRLEDVDLLVNATSLGMKGAPALCFDVSGLPHHAAVFDIVTTPLQTELIRSAKARGLFAQNGIPMLVYQAIPSFEAWFGKTPNNPDAALLAIVKKLSPPRPILIGLTGGIGMGKSTTAEMFADHGIAVWDADAAVHRLYAPHGQGAAAIAGMFKDVLDEDGAVDRARLSAKLAADPGAWERLNALIHPLVAADRQNFIDANRSKGARAVLCDIPLLFETNADATFDYVVVCSSPEDVRQQRVMARPGMTPDKYEAITARQMPDAEKRARADFVVDTGEGLERARGQVAAIVASIFEAKSAQDAT